MPEEDQRRLFRPRAAVALSVGVAATIVVAVTFAIRGTVGNAGAFGGGRTSVAPQ
jgi:hypothetical protein